MGECKESSGLAFNQGLAGASPVIHSSFTSPRCNRSARLCAKEKVHGAIPCGDTISSHNTEDSRFALRSRGLKEKLRGFGMTDV